MVSFDDLAKRLDAPAPVKWEPVEGDRLLGTITRIRYISGPHGPFGVIDVTDQAGDVYEVSCSKATIKRPLIDAKAQIGDLVGIEHRGAATSKAGHVYDAFFVVTEAVGDRVSGTWFSPDEHADDDLGLIPMGDYNAPPEDDPSTVPW